MSTSLLFHAAAITDLGRVRRQNEDRFLCVPDKSLFGVADGVGGLPAGARAAQAAVETVAREFASANIKAADDWRPIVQAANDAVVAKGEAFGGRLGIASTLTVGTVVQHQLFIAHIGDSRCLLLRDGLARCLTTDHSAENEAKLDPSKPAPPEKWRLALARCLGQPDALNPDFLTEPLHSGDRVVFATDGITRVISESELCDTLTCDTPLAERLAGLIDLAYDRGAPDNATAVVIEFLPPSHD